MKLIKSVVSSFRAKLLITFFILSVLPLILIGMISYSKTYNIISENSYSLSQLQTERVSREFDDVIQEINRFAEIGKMDSTLQFLIDKENTADEAKIILNMIEHYRESFQYSEYVMNIRIIGLDGKAISEDHGVHQLDNQTYKNLLTTTFNNQQRSPVIKSTYKNSTPALSLTSTISNGESKEVIGIMNIIIKASGFKDILYDTSTQLSGTFQVESENGDTLFISPEFASVTEITDRNMIAEKSSGYFSEGSTFVVFYTSELTGWKFIRYTPLSDITKDTTEIKSLIILTVGTSIIFIIFLYFIITSKLILPLRVLQYKMNQASSGDFTVKINNHSSDEIAQLGQNFNSMIYKIKTLLDKSVNEQKQLKIAELKTMQAQINPHFLYNTLETIIWMAEAKNTPKVIEITKALSHFFRISLSKGKDLILLKDEIEHIRNYLVIQKMRYQDILDVTFHLNEDILKYEIIKLTLQPLVENAIYHGIKNKRGKGFVRIKGDFTPEGYICIDVIDNGIGMSEEKLEDIRLQLSRGIPFDKDKGGFGMVNVHNRIQLHYGTPFGLKINSWYGSGTRVSLIIPVVDGDINEEDLFSR
ncbi:sensor histidine kinase [Litchfieldia salsa]|uniref:Two-component system, sensor histidine kinase YesM n=1 Tax=Litchfieldia salsa TaxID=930152 RepID=A0A1H0WAM7_9BACI|nr:sensor histidine kinase [Litchfieldia salsa]SDP87790.1 two-component system, sensor histidine kinase YesM [Litchfieldia salsa]